ncbi:DUF427-domain-containing protein [Schizophyllum commune H4-8]|uniref:DUF427 domain-containing protein n=1 Tax=Schizophyllum commune (strain H4-8 / FGSC 9210) TaxID=578458 RepID=D8Q094_SCHCM|nr:DUF427-domain-containing protein [Schizophyllum commune H4-8]KAI5896702.1 DUF427-domain-containing protein [Schizophyllum commune H4-8]
MKATLNGIVLAESGNTTVVEGNHYFPPGSIKKDLFKPSSTTTHCPWKGNASYYNVEVDGNTIKDAAWYYPNASEKAKNIENYVAFYKVRSGDVRESSHPHLTNHRTR